MLEQDPLTQEEDSPQQLKKEHHHKNENKYTEQVMSNEPLTTVCGVCGVDAVTSDGHIDRPTEAPEQAPEQVKAPGGAPSHGQAAGADTRPSEKEFQALQQYRKRCTCTKGGTRCLTTRSAMDMFRTFRGYYCPECSRDNGTTCICRCVTCVTMNVDGSGAASHHTPAAEQGLKYCRLSPTAEASCLELERQESEVHSEEAVPLDCQAAPSDEGDLDNVFNFSMEVHSYLNQSDLVS